MVLGKQQQPAKEIRNRKKIPPEKNPRYWNFFRVVLAGWIIRYPRNMALIALYPIIIWVLLIVILL